MDKERTLTEEGLWIEWEGDFATIGLSREALIEIGEVVYLSLPSLGDRVRMGEEVAVIESSKTAFDLYSPICGSIIAINDRLLQEVELLNTSPESAGWLYKIQAAPEGESSERP